MNPIAGGRRNRLCRFAPGLVGTQMTFTKQVRIASPADRVYAWHDRPGTFERLTPPWERIRIVDRGDGIRNGSRLIFDLLKGPLAIRWEALHRDCRPGRSFTDVQDRGPFAEWEHTHEMEPETAESSVLTDRIHYRLPLAVAGKLLGGAHVRRELKRMFQYRHGTTVQDIARHERYRDVGSLRIAVTGSSGFVGRSLCAFLGGGGHDVIRLVRRPPTLNDERSWDPHGGALAAAGLEGVDAVVHLAGESIVSGRWNDARKSEIRESRVRGTRLVAETLASMDRKPAVLVSASAIGIYGDRGDAWLDESSELEDDFLADVCREWEAATAPALEAGIRVVNLRIGVVLGAAGGALAKLLMPFKMGMGGRLGSGRQYMSWIAIDDVIGAIQHAIFTDSLEGPVNAVSPNPVTNLAFTKTLGRVLGRPTVLPMPATLARVALGEVADALLLASTRVRPARLQQSGFEFGHPTLESALRHELGR